MKRSLMVDLHSTRSTFYSGFPVIRGLAASLASIILVGGCAGPKVVGNTREEPTAIALGDFHADPGAVVPEPTTRRTPDPIDDAEAATRSNPSVPPDLTAQSGGHTSGGHTNGSGRAPIRSGDDGLEFIDAKVGDISGHPIYVSSFFEPIKARLTAAAAQKDLNAWRSDAIDIVKTRLDGIIYDELLRAETIAALTPQQRVGLQSFLKDFRSNLLSENLGSAQLANRRILEEQGITLDEALQQKELDTLVGLTLYQEINRGINISWRDIKQRYERDIEKYQPKPTVVLQVIRVIEPKEGVVESITDRLNNGEPFAEIASSDINDFNIQTQGTTTTVLVDAFEMTNFFTPRPLNEAVWTLSEGEWTGPVSLGNANFWILYAEKQQESLSLYEAQLQIFRELTQERRDSEREEYLNELIERARVSSRDEILLRLLYIAENNYGPAR